MALDPAKVGVVAAELMETLERDYPGGEVELAEVLVIAEVDVADGTYFRWNGSSNRSSVNAGLCAQAFEGLTKGGPLPDDEG